MEVSLTVALMDGNPSSTIAMLKRSVVMELLGAEEGAIDTVGRKLDDGSADGLKLSVGLKLGFSVVEGDDDEG